MTTNKILNKLVYLHLVWLVPYLMIDAFVNGMKYYQIAKDNLEKGLYDETLRSLT